MKTPQWFSRSWSEVTSGERNEIVFERLNKTYGAYEIRTNYDNTLVKAFTGTAFLIGLLASLYFILKSVPDIKIKLPDDHVVISCPGPPIYNPPPPTPPGNPKPPVTSTAGLKPEVTEDRDTSAHTISLNADLRSSATGSPSDTGSAEPNLALGGGGKSIEEDTTTYLSVAIQEQPRFPGGEDARYDFLRNNLRIPEPIREIGNIKERVGIAFTINKDGTISDIVLASGGSKYQELNREALRVINKMPAWEPGRQNGNPVRVRMIMPIKFEVK